MFTTIKGRAITTDTIIAGDIEVLRIGRNGKRRLMAEVRRDGVEFTMRIDPNEDYTVSI
jgi:hypothetical protein